MPNWLLLRAAGAFAEYRLIAKKGEGTFSEVLKAQSLKNGRSVAVKCMKQTFKSLDEVNNLREIQALRRLSPHPNIIKLYEVLYDNPSGRLALVFELMECNVYELIKGKRHYFPEATVKRLMFQLLRSMDHMHRNGIFHRDIKPENVLITEDETLKLADFGSCRGIYSKHPYTEYISTRWYRAPECLLTDGAYGYKMDIWGIGCVIFEVLALYPLFPGKDEADQINKVHDILGTPKLEVLRKFRKMGSHVDLNFTPRQGTGIKCLLPHCSIEAVNLVTQLLAYDPDDRITARSGMRHPWFADIRAEERQRRQAKESATSQAETKRALGGATKGEISPSPSAHQHLEGLKPSQPSPQDATTGADEGNPNKEPRLPGASTAAQPASGEDSRAAKADNGQALHPRSNMLAAGTPQQFHAPLQPHRRASAAAQEVEDEIDGPLAASGSNSPGSFKDSPTRAPAVPRHDDLAATEPAQSERKTSESGQVNRHFSITSSYAPKGVTKVAGASPHQFDESHLLAPQAKVQTQNQLLALQSGKRANYAAPAASRGRYGHMRLGPGAKVVAIEQLASSPSGVYQLPTSRSHTYQASIHPMASPAQHQPSLVGVSGASKVASGMSAITEVASGGQAGPLQRYGYIPGTNVRSVVPVKSLRAGGRLGHTDGGAPRILGAVGEAMGARMTRIAGGHANGVKSLFREVGVARGEGNGSSRAAAQGLHSAGRTAHVSRLGAGLDLPVTGQQYGSQAVHNSSKQHRRRMHHRHKGAPGRGAFGGARADTRAALGIAGYSPSPYGKQLQTSRVSRRLAIQ